MLPALPRIWIRPISLILSRRLSIQFDRNGNRTSVHEAKPGDINVPYLRFGGRKVSFDLGSGTMQVMNEPQNRKKSSPTSAASSFGQLRGRPGEAGASDHQRRGAGIRSL